MNKKESLSRRAKQLGKKLIPRPARKALFDVRTRMHRLPVLLTHLGMAKQCPLCGWHFNSFLPEGNKSAVEVQNTFIGGGYREQCTCPRCRASDRERALYLLLKKLGLFEKMGVPLSVLHIAPEWKLRKLIEKAPRVVSYTGTDIDLDFSNGTEQMDITDIHKPDNLYDVIICSHVLEHIVEDRKAMSELYRVLKPGGFALLQTPVSRVLTKTFEDPNVITEEERQHVFGQRDHVRIYAKDYANRLREGGFALELHTNTELYGREKAEYYGLIPDEVMYIGRKI